MHAILWRKYEEKGGGRKEEIEIKEG